MAKKPPQAVDPVKLRIAQQGAKLFLTQLASVPADVQLMAIEILAQTIFETGIKPEKRLELLDGWLKGVRESVLKPKKATTDGK